MSDTGTSSPTAARPIRALRHTGARALLPAVLIALLSVLLVPAARAEFDLQQFDVTYSDSEGGAELRAGAHPAELTTSLSVTTVPGGEGQLPSELLRDLNIRQIAGLAGDLTAVPPCSTLDFLPPPAVGGAANATRCPDSTAVGTVSNVVGEAGKGEVPFDSPVYNLDPPPGKVARLGFLVVLVPVTIDIGVTEAPPYNVYAEVSNTTEVLEFYSSEFTVWGVPADPAHDKDRGYCLSTGNSCPAGVPPRPFLTMPRSCHGPQATAWAADSWLDPGARLANGEPDLADPAWKRGFSLTHDEAIPPNPKGMSGCGKLAFDPAFNAQPTSRAASSPSGLDLGIDVSDEGLQSPSGLAKADIEKAVVTLPEGMIANPALAEGLEVCSEARFEAETPYTAPGQAGPFAPPGVACPEAAKLGTVEAETPLLGDTVLKGALYIAEPYRNPFDSLIALYMVIKDPELGILVKVPFEVTPDPKTGRLVTVGEDLPPFPISHFRLHFREGGRSPLITPPGCGGFEVKAELYPSSGGAPLDASSSFELISGPDGAPCPTGPAPFRPGFEAGTSNNAAGAYSPFYMRLTRADGEQDLTRFSAVLPAGVVGKIAGIPRCPEAGIARARSRTGEHGGTAELNDPSCPAAAQIGRTLAGAGAGSQLAYVPGSLYLAGPYAGDPLSVVAITPAVAGPFDAGTVVVREALTLNPVSGEVEVDGAASDPIPHILQGIPLNVRDLRVYVDRGDFTLNATNCSPLAARATLFGGGTLLAPAPDTPVALQARYQAADCAALGFKPKLAIKLGGGTKRGGHPALRAVVTPRPGDANFSRAVVTLPRSAFLDQAHIRTICTRVQFAAGAGNGALCPPGARYGFARAWSPLLDAPAQGPVFLRSSDNNLPDLVIALKGPASAPVDVELSARIDSVKGGIRSTFTGIPDLPVSRFILDMQGGKKGLIVNSRNLCHKPGHNRAKSNIRGQNGRFSRTKPVVRAVKCDKRKHE